MINKPNTGNNTQYSNNVKRQIQKENQKNINPSQTKQGSKYETQVQQQPKQSQQQSKQSQIPQQRQSKISEKR